MLQSQKYNASNIMLPPEIHTYHLYLNVRTYLPLYIPLCVQIYVTWYVHKRYQLQRILPVLCTANTSGGDFLCNFLRWHREVRISQVEVETSRAASVETFPMPVALYPATRAQQGTWSQSKSYTRCFNGPLKTQDLQDIGAQHNLFRIRILLNYSA